MTHYFLTIPHDSTEEPTMESMQDMDPEDFAAMVAEVDRFNQALKDAGAFIHAGGLQPPSTAITVDATGEEAVHVSEPIVSASEYVGGFWIVDAPDESTAVSWAEQCSRALSTRIEVRALQDEG